MVKFTSKIEDGTLVGLGLVEKNVEMLKKDKPIVVNLRDLGLPHDVKIMIFYGETEEQITKDLSGLINSNTNMVREKGVDPGQHKHQPL